MPERTPEHCHYTIIAPEGPGRVTPHPILGWDCRRAGMPTARSTGTVYCTWSYLWYVSHIHVWSNIGRRIYTLIDENDDVLVHYLRNEPKVSKNAAATLAMASGVASPMR